MARAEKTVHVELTAGGAGFHKVFQGAAKDTDSLKKGVASLGAEIKNSFSRAADSLGPFGSALKAIGPSGLVAAGAIGAVAIAARSAFDALGALAGQAEKWTNTAAATGLGVKEVQQLGAFLEDAGFQAEDLESIMKKLADSITSGDSALAQFGIDVRELKGLAPEEQLRELARQVTAIVDPTERAAAATAAFGKGGAKALAALQGIAAGTYKEMQTLSEGTIEELLKVDAELDAAGRSWTNWKNQVLVSLLHAGQGIAQFASTGFGSGAIVGALGAPRVDTTTGAEADAQRGRAISDTQGQIASEFARKQKAAALEKEKKEAAGAEAAAAKAQAERERRENAYAALKKSMEAEFIRQIKERDAAEKDFNESVTRQRDSQIRTTAAMAKALGELASEAQKLAGVDPAMQLLDAIEALGPTAVSADAAMEELAEQVLTLQKLGPLTAEQLARVNQEIERLQGQGAGKLPDVLKELHDRTVDWVSVLGQAGDVFAKLGLTDLGGLISQMGTLLKQTSAIKKQIDAAGGWKNLSGGDKANIYAGAASGAVDIGVSAYQGASTSAGKSVAKGALSGAAKGAVIGSVLPGIGTAIGAVVGGVIGGVAGYFGSKKKTKELLKSFDDQLIQQFGSIEKAKKEAEKYGIALDKALDSKKPKAIQAAMEKLNKELQKRANLEAGLATAQQNVESLQDATKGSTNEKLKAAVQALADKVSNELLKAGLGFAATGPLRDSEAFQGAQGISRAAAGTVGGLRQAGVVDQGVIDAAGQIAGEVQKEAFEAAKAAGLDDAAATKASFGAVSDLLREQLNASLASGRELDANTKALIEEAKKNGIDILADPAIEAVAVAKDQLKVLEQIAGKGAGDSFQERGGAAKDGAPEFAMGTGGFQNFGAGTDVRLHGWEAVVPASGPSMPSMSMPSMSGLNASSAMLLGGARSATNVSYPVEINLSGSATMQDAQLVAGAVAKAIRSGHQELLRELQRVPRPR